MPGKPSLITRMMAKKLTKLGGVRHAVLAYKHYLETGERKVNPEFFEALYPEPGVI